MGIRTIVSVISIPGEPVNDLIFGLTKERSLLIMVLAILTMVSAVFIIKSFLRKEWFSKFSYKLSCRLSGNHYYFGLLFICLILFINGLNILLGMSGITEPVTLAYYVRIRPVIIWFVIICVQTIFALYLLKNDYQFNQLKEGKNYFVTVALVFSLLITVWFWISLTGYGLSATDIGNGWHVLGTPILETQVILVWFISVVFLVFTELFPQLKIFPIKVQSINKDQIIGLLIWLFALTIWIAQPLKSNWFVSEPRPPNFEFYPNSDSSVYDVTARNLLLGEGFKTRGSPFTLRPLYAAALAGMHYIVGPEYENIIFLQVALLAIIPVLLYKSTKAIHNRTSGIFVALLFTIREANAIKLGDSISEAHPKLLLPFLPTALGILLFIYVISSWLENPTNRKKHPLILGGIMGGFMLVRPEFVTLLFFIGLAALLQLRRNLRVWFKGMILVVFGAILILAPWIWRNYQLTGTIYIDSPHYRLDFISKRYRDDPISFSLPLQTPNRVEITPLPTSDNSLNDNSPQANNIPTVITYPTSTQQPQNSIQDYTVDLGKGVIEYIVENPNETRNFILNHLLNSVIQTVIQLPTSHPLTMSSIRMLGHKSADQFWLDCCSLIDYERRNPFWPTWDGILPRTSIIPILVNVFFISAGISSAWKKNKFIGLIPLLAAFGYYLVNALVRNSGGRYTVPVNWVGISYFGIGIIQISFWLINLVFTKQDKLAPVLNSPPHVYEGNLPLFTKANLLISISLLAFGSSLPILERVIPIKYNQASIDGKISELLDPENTILIDEELVTVNKFLNNNGNLLNGLALYPRFHKPYQMGSVWNYYHDRPYSHLDFYLSSPYDSGIVLPLDDPPVKFPDAVDVTVLGCPEQDYYSALAVIIYSSDDTIPTILWRSPLPVVPGCPLPNP